MPICYETAARVGKLRKGAAVQAVEEALAAVGMEYKDVRGKYPNQFSGGELQRASVARALIPHPSLIVADEPVSMIDASRRMIIINLFLALKQEYQTSFLYITHDLATAYYISDYIAVMNKGAIVEFGDAKQVLSNPQHAYTQLLLDSIPAGLDQQVGGPSAHRIPRTGKPQADVRAFTRDGAPTLTNNDKTSSRNMSVRLNSGASFELALHGSAAGNPFLDVELTAEFSYQQRTRRGRRLL